MADFTGTALQYGQYLVGIIDGSNDINYFAEKCNAVVRSNITILAPSIFKACGQHFATQDPDNILAECMQNAGCPLPLSIGAAVGITLGAVVLVALAVIAICTWINDSGKPFSCWKSWARFSTLKSGSQQEAQALTADSDNASSCCKCC